VGEIALEILNYRIKRFLLIQKYFRGEKIESDLRLLTYNWILKLILQDYAKNFVRWTAFKAHARVGPQRGAYQVES
jgi:hypothetical protein